MRKRKGLLFNSEQSGWVTVETAGGAPSHGPAVRANDSSKHRPCRNRSEGNTRMQ